MAAPQQTKEELGLAISMEQARAAKATYLMTLLDSVKRFEGEVRELDLFVERMDVVHEQLIEAPLDPSTDKSIRGYFLARVSLPVMLELGMSFNSSWEEVKRALKERYAGAARPVARSALKLLEMRKDRMESCAEFGRRLADSTKKIKMKVNESCQDAIEAMWRTKIYEEIATEVLMRTIPERVRTALRILKPKTLEDTVIAIREEENDREDMGRDFGKRTEADWNVVSRRERTDRRGAKEATYRVNRERTIQWNRDSQESRRPREKYEENRFGKRSDFSGMRTPGRRNFVKQRRGCWECNDPGHFARECPYIYRRNERHNRTYAQATRDEPMEINAVRKFSRSRDRRTEDGDSTDEEGVTSASDSDRTDNRYVREKWNSRRDWPELKRKQEPGRKITEKKKED